MDGTCKECDSSSAGTEATDAEAQDDEVVYTFWNDISKNTLVVKMMLNVTQSMQQVLYIERG